jgi:Zn-dependent protease
MDILFFSIIILIISAVTHEMAHGYAADFLGDPTPRLQGRLSINPLKHLDPVGSFLLPLLTYNIGGFIFGWAKPVEFDPYNLKHPKRDEMIIAIAGPVSNAIIAGVFGLMVRFNEVLQLPVTMVTLASLVVIINLSLMVFNLMPIPPLDGSKLLLNSIPEKYHAFKELVVRNSLVIFVLFVLFGASFITPVIQWLFTLINSTNEKGY